MTKSDKAVMQLALDALVEYEYAKTDKADNLGFESICALREAIAQPLQTEKRTATDTLVERLRHTASKGVSVWGDLQINAANTIDALLTEIDSYASTRGEQNFCSRCGKRLGKIEDIHTCTEPPHLNLGRKTVERLHKFLDACGGDGVISDGVDAGDLYMEIFPELYDESI